MMKKTRVRLGDAIALCLCIFLCRIATAQLLEVTPRRVPVDEPAAIRVTGLEANERITIEAGLVDGEGDAWSSSAEFIANDQGSVDVSAQAPVAGSYKEVSAMGLVWSMKPKGKTPTYAPPKDLAPQTIRFRLLRKGQPSATAEMEQLYKADGVRETRVKGTVHGVLFEPPGNGPYPAMLVLGGSEGGLPRQRAAWLASHGFAALALAYFHYEDLPERLERIPLEYFGAALGWMSQRPEILPDAIAVMGTSRGGELALLLGSVYPQIRAVVAYVPANVVYGACCGRNGAPFAWTWHGSPLAYASPRQRDRFATEQRAAIHVENTHGPLLLISGDDDGIWESGRMADEVIARLKQVHFPYDYENLKYHHAGHRAGRPGFFPTWHGRMKHPISGQEENLGGNVEGDAQSAIDATPKVLAFLGKNLASSPAQKPPAATGTAH